MKKILSILLLSIFIVSCGKSEDPIKDVDKIKVEQQNLSINHSLGEY